MSGRAGMIGQTQFLTKNMENKDLCTHLQPQKELVASKDELPSCQVCSCFYRMLYI